MKSKQSQKSSAKPEAAIKHADVDFQRENQREPTPARRRDDQKRNDQQQYHAGGIPHDPKRATQGRVDAAAETAVDLDKVSNSDDAPFNKTYGQHE